MQYKRGTRRYLTQFTRRFFEALGVAAAAASGLAVIAPDLLKERWWLFVVIILAGASWAAFKLRQKEPIQQFRENIVIRLVVGDLFTQDASAMVGMSTTFDTAVPDVIAPNSVQGSFLKRIYNGSQSTLDADLNKALSGVSSTGTIDKPGKKTVYPMGTVAVLSGSSGLRYYCAAYTTMDTHNRANGKIRSVLDSLDNVWDCVDKHGSGEPICVPLLGQGQARIPELTAEVAVRLIAFSFLLRTRRSRFSSELRIVVHPNEVGKIDLVEFQAFLTSLASA